MSLTRHPDYRSTPRTLGIAVFGFITLTGCANSNGKPYLPIVAKIGAEVRAISSEDSKSICRENYCEDNQIYVAHFGRRRSSPAPIPVPPTRTEPSASPTRAPANMPSQPAERLDYSRRILNVESAWRVSEGSPEVLVAVIDSGIDYFHPDLKDAIAVDARRAPGFVGDTWGWDFYHDRANGFDDNGHGTHCAGVIAAAKNGIGVRGIAPRVKILPVKFLGPDGSGDTADAVRAIDYAVARGARILSNSWGGGGYSKLLDDAIQRAVNKGVIFVAAAGNNGSDNDASPNYPANYENVISVGSSDDVDERSTFSNYGDQSVHFFAPGSGIFSTYPGGTYRSLSGTSMATPQVAGALALGLSLRPTLTRAQAIDDLCSSAEGRLFEFSKCGRVDIGAFVKRVDSR